MIMINALVETFCGTLATAVVFYAVNEINSARLLALENLSASESALMNMLKSSPYESAVITPEDDKNMQSMDIDELFFVCSQLSDRSLKMLSNNDPQAMLAYDQFVHYTRHLLKKCIGLKTVLDNQEDIFAVLYHPLRSRHIGKISAMISDNFTTSSLLPFRQLADKLDAAYNLNITELQKPKSNSVIDAVALYAKFNALFENIDRAQYPEDILKQITQIKNDVDASAKDHLSALNALFLENELNNQPDLFKDRPGTVANNLIAYLDLIKESDVFSKDLRNYKNLGAISSAMNATTLNTPGSGYTMPRSVVNRADEMRKQMQSLRELSTERSRAIDVITPLHKKGRRPQ
ncbi:MAG: hypothetical protein CMF43_00560 [Legionellales bacterium]|nr:hypothetical protein [Legionellales bacterium]|tara:strand:- start:2390 stop:3436 length:1047 start_codon:yes stop_codon:yes gene_type:complete